MNPRAFAIAILGLVLLGGALAVGLSRGLDRDVSGDLDAEFAARATERSIRFDNLADRGDASDDFPFLAAPDPAPVSSDPTDVVNRVGPAVVTVVARQSESGPSSGEIGRGTGFVVSDDGYVITNWHVVSGADGLTVIMADGDERTAKLVGGDDVSDLAVMRVDGEFPATVPLGDSTALQPGQPVLALGSPLGTFTNTVTRGVVSGVGRTIPGAAIYTDLVQHDAAVNPGNSGGPLVNLAGEVVGVNTFGISATEGGDSAQGIFFAIPSNTVREIAARLIRDGSVVYPYLGVLFEPVTPSLVAVYDLPVSLGVIIGEVLENGPAAPAGLRPNDVILAIDDQPIDTAHPLIKVLMDYVPGDSVMLTVWRNGDEIEIDLTLDERPGDE
jgi:2-alkenal reductase